MNHSRRFLLFVVLALLVPMLPSCGEERKGPAHTETGKKEGQGIPASFFVAQAPEGAISVREAIGSAKPGQELVVRAVIGGRKKAFVDGRAILVAIDPTLDACGEEDGCPTPWDYCCETKETLLSHTMTIQVVDPKGAPFPKGLQGVHGLKELKTIVVSGKVRSAEGSLVLDASKIHVVGG